MKIVWTDRAISHLTGFRKHIAKDSEAAAARTVKQIIESVELLVKHPEIGRTGRILGTRELVIGDAGFIIPYRVKQGRVELLAVFHGSQNRTY